MPTTKPQSDSASLRRPAVRDAPHYPPASRAPLSDEDQVVQAKDDASPTKWHLAHTTWFFEAFLLKRFLPRLRVFDKRFEYCFNSYYESVGARQPRGKRGLLTRPSARRGARLSCFRRCALGTAVRPTLDPEAAELIELGINHEQQHQELLLTDILAPVRRRPAQASLSRGRPRHCAGETAPLEWIAFDGGIVEVGS